MNLSACASWICKATVRENGSAINKGAPNCQEIVQSGPGPSPGSSGSNDDVQPTPKNCYRLVVLGSAKVGKTGLVSRFLGAKFDDTYTPTIEDFHRKLYRIRGEIYQLDILDTSGNHPFPAMRRLSFLTGDLFIIVFSMDSRETFEEAIRLREQILETKLSAYTGTNSGGYSAVTKKRNMPKVPMVLCGNKSDKDMRTVSCEEALTYCQTQDSNCAFIEVSAKKNHKVDDLFYELFLIANLPLEMAPNHHKRVSANFGSPNMLPMPAQVHQTKKYTLSVKRRLSEACGVVAPNVRRPSIRSDLMMMKTKTSSFGDHDSSSSSGWTKVNKLGLKDYANCVLQ